MIEEIKTNPQQTGINVSEYIASVLSKASSISYGKPLGSEEMQNLIDNLFLCENHNFSPDGKPIMAIIQMDELEKKFK